MLEGYLTHILILIGIYLILGISLQLSIGITGLFNLGHIGFFAIGAYTSALLALNGFPYLFAFAASGAGAMLAGFLLSLMTRRLKGDYFALVSIAFSLIIYAIALNWVKVTNGSLGLSDIPRPVLFGYELSGNFSFFILTLAVAVSSYAIIYRIINSNFGKVMESIRDDETASKILGKDTLKMKSLSLGVSGFFAGIAGSLYANYMTFIDPLSFTFIQLIPIICIITLGGMGSLKGTLIVTATLVFLSESIRFIGIPLAILSPMRQIVYSVILLAVLLFKPKGLYGKIEL
jgi:branched-chain amino acid transport system permease protein